MLRKINASTPCFSKTGNEAISISAGTQVFVGGRLITFPLATAAAIDTGALAAGTDYTLYVTSTGLVVFSANRSSPLGYSTATALKIGGFHFAAGSCAAAQAGGDTTPAINPYSIWDLKFRPACLDPRGMALIAGGFWADIYLMNATPDALGTSAHGATICDGSSPAKIPVSFGGDGVAAFATMTWFEASQLLAAFGKRPPNQHQFMALAYGVTEATSVGADPVTTQIDAPRTSRFGIMQATGNMWIWGLDSAVDPTSVTAVGWQADTGGRGSSYIYGAGTLKRVILGARWADGVVAGSRASYWSYAPSASGFNIGARGVCDPLVLP